MIGKSLAFVLLLAAIAIDLAGVAFEWLGVAWVSLVGFLIGSFEAIHCGARELWDLVRYICGREP